MTPVNLTKNELQAAKAKAQSEVQAERIDAAVKKLKDLYRQLASARTVVENIEREIADYERAVEDGNG